MRPLWKGSISFGLVNIPVKLHVATQEHDVKFIMLHKKDLSKIRYARMCKIEEKEIPWNEIVKGYEYSTGEYVVISEDDLKKIHLNRSKSIDILHFIDEEEINTIYYSKPYSLRAVAKATVSTPLEWEEVRIGLKPDSFTIRSVISRLKEKKELFSAVLKKKFQMKQWLEKQMKDFTQ